MRSNNKQIYSSVMSAEVLADIYVQLSRLEEAGFPAQQAFALLQQTNNKIQKRIQQLQKYLKLGRSVTESGVRAGVFNTFDKDLLNAGESSGNLGSIYQQLAGYYSDKARRVKKIKSQSYLPITILTLALFIQPLPALVANEISGLEYMIVSAGRLFKMALFLYVVIKLPFWLTRGSLQFFGLGSLVFQLQFKLPLISSWLIPRQINEFLRSLGLMLSAGMPVLDALPKAINTIRNPILRKQFEPVLSATQKGGSVAEALAKVSEIDRQAVQMIFTGEQSGKRAETILHFTKIESEKINLQEELLAEWIPRVFYLLVIGVLAFSLINSNPFSPVSL